MFGATWTTPDGAPSNFGTSYQIQEPMHAHSSGPLSYLPGLFHCFISIYIFFIFFLGIIFFIKMITKAGKIGSERPVTFSVDPLFDIILTHKF